MDIENYQSDSKGSNSLTFQEYLNQLHPTKEEKEQVKEIIINGLPLDKFPNTLTKEEAKELIGGELNLKEYLNLETLIIDGNCLKSKLTELDLSNCSQLTMLGCSGNQLTELNISNCPNLR